VCKSRPFPKLHETVEFKELPEDDISPLFDTTRTKDLIETIVKGAVQLIPEKNSLRRLPTVKHAHALVISITPYANTVFVLHKLLVC